MSTRKANLNEITVERLLLRYRNGGSRPFCPTPNNLSFAPTIGAPLKQLLVPLASEPLLPHLHHQLVPCLENAGKCRVPRVGRGSSHRGFRGEPGPPSKNGSRG